MSPATGTRERELREYLRVLRRRKVVVVLATLATVAGALAVSALQTPMYAATAKLLLQPRVPELVLEASPGQRIDPARVLLTEIQVIESLPVRERVLADEPAAPTVSATPVGQTDVVALRVESPDAGLAARAANLYAAAYIDHRREQDVQGLREALAAVDQQIINLRAAVAAASDADRPGLEDTLRQRQETRENLDLSIQSRTGGAQLVNQALVPSDPFSPDLLRNGALALVVGLLLGAGLAFLRDYLDDSIKTKEDLERASGNLPTLGLIPVVGTWRTNEEARVVSIAQPSSRTAEAYRTLRTAVQFIGVDKPIRIIQVTSPWAMEGKTTTISNLGVALARAGFPVVIVCCDLRRPRVHEFFGFSNAVGFTSVLLGERSLQETLQPVLDVPRLSVLASGPLPPNPSELLSSAYAGEMLASLTANDQIVLVDSPPVLPVTDGLVLSRWVDATLLVCAAGATSRHEVVRAVELLGQVNAPLAGTVLNGVSAEGGYGYGYGYGYRADPYADVANGDRAANGDGYPTKASRKQARRAARQR